MSDERIVDAIHWVVFAFAAGTLFATIFIWSLL